MRLVLSSLRASCTVRGGHWRPAALQQVRSMAIKRRWRKDEEEEAEPSIDAEVEEFCKAHPINEELLRELGETQEVMLIGETGGVVRERVRLPEALEIAKGKGLDVTVVQFRELTAAQRAEGKVPVCKVLDFAALLQSKKEAFLAVKSSELEEVHKPKEMRFSINIAEHDANIKCRKMESHLNQGYGVTAILQFGAPIPYNKEIGEEFFTQLLAKVDDKCGTCSGFTHNAKKGEIRVELTPTQGSTRGRAMLKKELLAKRT